VVLKAKALLDRLLAKPPAERLTAAEARGSAWLADVDWVAVLAKRVAPPAAPPAVPAAELCASARALLAMGG
jgi:hypothetical protein